MIEWQTDKALNKTRDDKEIHKQDEGSINKTLRVQKMVTAIAQILARLCLSFY